MARSRIARDSALSQPDIIALLITEDPDVFSEVDWKKLGVGAALVGGGIAAGLGIGGGEAPQTKAPQTIEQSQNMWYSFVVEKPDGDLVDIDPNARLSVPRRFAQATRLANKTGGKILVFDPGSDKPIPGHVFQNKILPKIMKKLATK